MPRLILALLVLVAFCFFLENDWQTKPSFSDLRADLNLSGLRLSYGRDGEKKFAVRAVSGQFLEPQDRIVLLQPVILFESKQKIPIEVRSPRGEIKRQKGVALLDSPVRGRWGRVRLEARQLTYDAKSEIVLLRDGVRANSPDFSLDCRDMELSLKSGQMRAKGDVKVFFSSGKG